MSTLYSLACPTITFRFFGTDFLPGSLRQVWSISPGATLTLLTDEAKVQQTVTNSNIISSQELNETSLTAICSGSLAEILEGGGGRAIVTLNF